MDCTSQGKRHHTTTGARGWLRHLHFVMEFISWQAMFGQAAWGELFFPGSGEIELFLASLVIGHLVRNVTLRIGCDAKATL